MKPLPSAPLTMLDFQILSGLWPGRDWMRTALLPIGHSMEADRRDAALMLKLLRTRTGNPAEHLIRATYGLPFWDIEAIVSGWLV